ncbi:hypothetical protein CANINC_000131 [Pichia inconspicua]|uniref:DH domain-containing protein n=1 Tax=Pichia inconspicua TaxID=52247 RepID=A0A4V4NGB2_9ASCO|nr:hypothetical protein CANINC_000131 [[Candida] inconspicua]
MFKSTSKYQINQTTEDVVNEKYWIQRFPNAAYFHVYNTVLGDVFAMIYNNNLKDSSNHTLSSFIIAKHGCSVHPIIDISPNTKYYPAIQNLAEKYQSSKVRKALAVSLLKTFADLSRATTERLYEQANLSDKSFDWDETQAGLLASQMELLDTRPPFDIGSYLYELGYLTSNLSTSSYIVDVVYTDDQNEEITEKNNTLALMLGRQLDTLFDSLTEYSPEPTEKVYKAPSNNGTKMDDNELIQSICDELISVQTNYTVMLVQFLQNFIVPLRTQILENKLPGFTMNQINQIFPPTIDEVTRINCIFLDMLKLAQPYGSYEILKACGTTIPYFYKAQMRHEAAIKNFNANLNIFSNRLSKIGRSDLLSFDQRHIETCIYSSLSLVKLQLIIQRLVKNKEWPDELKENVNKYAESCDNTISSFAKDNLKPYNGRVFTPTGKIITELAKGWPAELQFGWLTRRVVAVFDTTDLLVAGMKNRAVIIVFSDHVLFLSIDDDNYYADYWDDSNIHKPSISDMLIHSLTNETPLNKIPNMTVQAWANINDLYAFHYSTSSNTPKSFVRFFNEKSPEFSGIYMIDKVSGKYVTEVIARSKILNKSQSFHLFCGTIEEDNEKKKVYYTAHERNLYLNEETRSPFVVLFNKPYNEQLLDEYNVYAFITLNFINPTTVRLEGLSRCLFDDVSGNEKFTYNVNLESLSETLSLILTELFTTHMSLYNSIMVDYLLKNNGKVNKRAHEVLTTTLKENDLEKQQIVEQLEKLKRERQIINDINTKKVDRKKSLELLEEKEVDNDAGKRKIETSSPKAAPTTSKNKKGFFSFFKSKKQVSTKKDTERKSSVIYKRISSITKSADPVTELKPANPKKERAPKRPSQAFASSTLGTKPIEKESQVEKVEVNNFDASGKESGRDNETTASTAIYVNSRFEFPMEPEVEQTNTPKYAHLKGENSHNRGYKDSVDLMGAFQSPVKAVEPVKNNYDDDLFELNNKGDDLNSVKQQVDDNLLQLQTTEATDLTKQKDLVIKEEVGQDEQHANKNLWRDLTKPNKIETFDANGKLTPPSTPKMVGSPVFTKTPISPNTPKTQSSPRVIRVPNNNERVIRSPGRATNGGKPFSFINQMESVPHLSPQPYNPTVSPVLPKIHKSESFYVRFKQLRDEQDKRLKQYGIARVPDFTQLSLNDQSILKSGFIVVDDTLQEHSETTTLSGQKILDKSTAEECTATENTGQGFKVKVIDSKVVHKSPQRHVSTTSSVYATTEDESGVSFKNFASIPIREDEEIYNSAFDLNNESVSVDEDILGLNLDMRDMSMISFSDITLNENDDSFVRTSNHKRNDVSNGDFSLVRDESYSYLGEILHPKMKRDKTEYDIVLKRRLADSKSVGWMGKYLGE